MSLVEPNYQIVAAALTASAALVLFALGFVLQLVIYDLNGVFSQYELPAASKPLYDWFGLRPTAYLIHVVFWCWWPFLAGLIYTHLHCPNNQQFGRVFASYFLLCCAAVASLLSIIVVMAAFPRVLLRDIREPPAIVQCLPVVSYCLPIVMFVISTRWLYQTAIIVRDPKHGIRLTYRPELTEISMTSDKNS